MKRDNVELLSPAGSFDVLIAAVQNGADAVYLGGREFNARINADNFPLPEMKKAIDYCHIRGVRVYAAVNTLVSDEDFLDAVKYVKELYLLGIDAVIVQDVGLADALMRIFPDLPIHASTQMTVHNCDGACLLKNMGFERLILSREVSLKNIRRIKEKAKVILECFCHGAICISYSGQCLMSSFMFGRSGNRGVCAQPCRLKYSLVKGSSEVSRQSYMLSPRDLCTIKAVDKIGEVCADTIKIEGRMRSPEYVACVTDAYRDGIDKGFVDAEKISGLSKVFNRGFCGGFVLGDTREFINDIRQNNQGLYIGCCRSYDRKAKLMRMRLEEDLCVGDGLRIDSGDDEIGCKVKSIAIGKNIVKEAGRGDTVSLKVDKIVAENSPVYKTFDKKADAWAKGTYLKGKEIRKVGVEVKVRLKDGEPFSVEVFDGENTVCSESSVSAEKAVRHAMTPEMLKEQLSRLGNTPFSIDKFVFDVDERLMIPLSEIGKVRKEVVLKLEEMRASVPRMIDDKTFTDMTSKTMAISCRKAKINELPKIHYPTEQSSGVLRGFSRRQFLPFLMVINRCRASGYLTHQEIKRTKISVHVGSMSALKDVLGTSADEVIIGNGFNSKEDMDLAEASELVKESGKILVFATPAILTDPEVNEMLGVVQRLRPDAVLVSNPGLLKVLIDSKDVESEIHLDYPLNVYNMYTAKALVSLDKKIRRVCASVELSFEKVRKMSRSDTEVECVVHGRLPVMTSEYCIFSKKCSHQCEKGYGIVDR
ncbi:MAG: DUF3656 domain-containing protein, partial [archaeon]|nr:DUF3656 domain-containing protein [archaeon]